MNLAEAARIGTVADVINQIQLFKIIVTMILPLILLIIVIAIIVRLRKHNDKIKKATTKQTTRSKPFNTSDEMFNSLSDIGEPLDKNRYKSLVLTFDNRGKAIALEDNNNG